MATEAPSLPVAIVQLIGALAWPAVALYLFFAFRKPLLRLAARLPDKFADATKIGVGLLTLEIQAQAAATGNSELAGLIGTLSPNAVEQLIRTGPTAVARLLPRSSFSQSVDGKTTSRHEGFTLPSHATLAVLRELEHNGLLEFSEELDPFYRWVQSDLFHAVGQGHLAILRPTRPLAETEQERLDEMSYHLTEQGLEAWQAVLKAVLKLLSQPAPVPTFPPLPSIDGRTSDSLK